MAIDEKRFGDLCDSVARIDERTMNTAAGVHDLGDKVDTNNFNCFPSPQIWEHAPTSNRWAVVVWDRSRLASAFTNDASFSNKLAEVKSAAGGTTWIRIEQVGGCAEFAALMKKRNMVIR